MAKLSDFFKRLTRGMAAQALAEDSDQQLVDRALAGDEAAIQAIVHRHGPMVFRVCWRVLQHSQDTEDAFQATFLVLAQKLRMLRKQTSLASWLHGVAYRVALKARAQSAARRSHEQHATRPDSLPPDDVTWGELRSALDGELEQLPDKWRQPLILCYLEGRTQDETAQQLGWSKSTLRRRLEEARTALVGRLGKRGVVWPAALSAVLLSDCVLTAAPRLVAAAVEGAAGVLAGKSVAAVASVNVALLADGVLKIMLLSKLKTAISLLLAVGLGLGLLGRSGLSGADADHDGNVGQTIQIREAAARSVKCAQPTAMLASNQAAVRHDHGRAEDGGKSLALERQVGEKAASAEDLPLLGRAADSAEPQPVEVRPVENPSPPAGARGNVKPPPLKGWGGGPPPGPPPGWMGAGPDQSKRRGGWPGFAPRGMK